MRCGTSPTPPGESLESANPLRTGSQSRRALRSIRSTCSTMAPQPPVRAIYLHQAVHFSPIQLNVGLLQVTCGLPRNPTVAYSRNHTVCRAMTMRRRVPRFISSSHGFLLLQPLNFLLCLFRRVVAPRLRFRRLFRWHLFALRQCKFALQFLNGLFQPFSDVHLNFVLRRPVI